MGLIILVPIIVDSYYRTLLWDYSLDLLSDYELLSIIVIQIDNCLLIVPAVDSTRAHIQLCTVYLNIIVFASGILWGIVGNCGLLLSG